MSVSYKDEKTGEWREFKMIEFTRDELFTIKREVQGTLESAYIGVYQDRDFDLSTSPVEVFDMPSAQAMSLRGILKKVKDIE